MDKHAKCTVFMRSSVTLLVPRRWAADTTSAAASDEDRCRPEEAQTPRGSTVPCCQTHLPEASEDGLPPSCANIPTTMIHQRKTPSSGRAWNLQTSTNARSKGRTRAGPAPSQKGRHSPGACRSRPWQRKCASRRQAPASRYALSRDATKRSSVGPSNPRPTWIRRPFDNSTHSAQTVSSVVCVAVVMLETSSTGRIRLSPGSAELPLSLR